ncbi:hypothetical protein [Paenibacillus sp. Marseille-Q9583]
MDVNDYYLQDDVFMTPSEAAYRWRMKRNTLIAALNRGRFDHFIREGSTKKFTQHGATEWLVSVRAMREAFGDEDKLQVFELGNLQGETSEPRSAIYFDYRWLCMSAPGVLISEEVLDLLRTCEAYEDALKIASDCGFEVRSVEEIIGQLPLYGFPDKHDLLILRENKTKSLRIIAECLGELKKTFPAGNDQLSPYLNSCKKLLEDVSSRLN